MTKVMNCYLVHKRTDAEWLTTSCWVDYIEGMKIGDKVRIDEDSKDWEIHTLYTGSVKEEAQMMEGAKFGKVVAV